MKQPFGAAKRLAGVLHQDAILGIPQRSSEQVFLVKMNCKGLLNHVTEPPYA